MTTYPFKEFNPDIHKTVFVAQGTSIIGRVKILEHASVWYNCVLRADIAEIVIGKGSNVQDGSVLHVDYDTPCIIGDNVTVGHNAILHACTVHNNARIGMGAIVLNGAIIEEGAQVGAGAVVAPGKVVEKNTLFVGIPAKKLRDHGKIDNEDIINNAKSYVDLAQMYKNFK